MNYSDNNLSDIPIDIIERYNEMMKFRKSRRTQEEIISDIVVVIRDYSKECFIPFLMDMIIHINLRNISAVYKNLMSPMKQIIYLIDLFFVVKRNGDKLFVTKNEWQTITELLNEIEMTYFCDIGFSDESKHFDYNKVSVSLQTFTHYFGNAQLSFDEQTLERFERNCGAFDEEVKKIWGFTTKDAIVFCNYIKTIINKKYNDCLYYLKYKEEWEVLTSKFIERGINDPRDWWNEPELELLKKYRINPGTIFVHSIEDLEKVNLHKNILENLLDFLCYNENQATNTVVYYANKNPFLDTPIIKLSDGTYSCPIFKFLIEAFYNRINSGLNKELENKYSHCKNQILETKTYEIFKKLFGKETRIFQSYYVDENESEQDLLVLFKGFCFIIEIKDKQFRAPMRDPIKAYDKIKSDFKKSVQYGYDQCKRVEDKIEANIPFKIFDKKTKRPIYEINPKRIKNYDSIIVTQFKYGGIQTNLKELLFKEKDRRYPWSICIDDLEAFVLLLKKLKKGMSRTYFIDYLLNRELYHEHIICSDELELCGYYINSPYEFKQNADSELIFSTFAGMSDVFDAEYQNGLGFDNEIDIEYKKYKPVPYYSKDYTINKISGEELMKMKNITKGH
jgi:hypothetical protein